ALRQGDLAGAAPSVIGAPLRDLAVYVLDAGMQPVPIGVPGEIYVGGAGVARGYLGRPDLTAARFVPDALSGHAGGRLYRSGDLARYLPNGDLHYLGRIDQQVKVRGFRIELGEIEAALAQHPAIREVLVLARADGQGEQRLVAYLVGEPGNTGTPEQTNQEHREHQAPEPPNAARETPTSQRGTVNVDLRSFLKTTLPDYMVPSAFIWLDAFPLTTNGKIDRRALPEPDQSRPELGTALVAPRTPTEEALAAAWAEVLGIERVGVYDNFFGLGGDSIRSLQVVAAARARGIGITIQQMFEHQTIAELAEMITPNALPSPQLASFDQLSPADREKLPPDVEIAYPLATLQSGMLFHSAASPEAALYHDCFSFHLRAPYDPAALHSALDSLSARHAVLRTSFDLSRFEQPLQLVHAHAEVPLTIDDLRALDPSAQEAALAEWLAVEQHTPFDWTHAPLLRVALHRRTDATFQLTLSCHHAVLDGWSVALLIGELFQLYRAALGRSVQSLPAPGQSFADFVALEQQALNDPAQLDYWRARLDGSTLTTVPRWGPPQPEAEQAASRAELDIPPEVVDGLRRLAQTTNVPFKSVLLAAHLRVLSLLGDQTDIVTGLVINGRPETERSDRTLGMFLNTIPLRLNLAGGTWSDLVRATFAAERDALPYRRYPLARLQQQLGGQPLFETAFNFVHFHVLQSLEADDAIEGIGGTAIARTNFPLAAHFSQDPATGELQLALDYDPTLLRSAQVDAYGGYYARTLAAMAREPLARYETIDLLTEAERRYLLVDWSTTAAPSQERCVHELFAAQAAQTPEATAVVFVDGDATERLSYAELDRRADRLAHELQAHGVRPEMRIGLYLDRSPELIVAILGVLKSGGAYVPLDPTYPAERLRFMLTDADVSIVLTRQQLTQQLTELDPARSHVLCLDADWPMIEAAEMRGPAARVLPEQLAYMIYTSGSTGQPKGVLVPHRGIGNLAQAQIAAFDVRPDSRVLQFAALSFDAAVSEICMALLAGAALYLAPRETLLPGPGLLDLMDRHAIDVVTLPPSALAAMPIAELPALRTIAVAGEACPPDVLARWERPGRRLINAYGPTETTVCATMAEVLDSSQRPPIGRPIDNTQVFVLDDQLQPVPLGVPGEVLIGGLGLARGYHHRPDLTAERFVPHPFSEAGYPQGGARLYRTGDLARWLPDGSLDYLRRRDDQIKLRGFRIELGEIEAVLRQHPSVCQCVVVVRNAGHDAQRLVAYVVEEQRTGALWAHNEQNENQEPETWNLELGTRTSNLETLTSELRQFLEARLPGYMIPSAFVVLDALPVTPSGKLDRTALPEPEAALPDVDWVAPRDRWELDVARLWQELLQSGPVGVDDDFFKRGGDSLLAVRLVARIEQELGRRIQVASLIGASSVAQIAAMLRQQPAEQEWSPLVAIQPGGSRPPLFCVHPIGGHVLCYVKMAQEIGLDQPCYGLQARGLEQDEPPPMSIEAMATDYLAAIRAVQPHGPYLLSGWSFGGVVAFEMAQQLLRQGEEVALLALLDSSLDPPIQAALTPTEEILNLAWGLGGIFGKELGLTAEELEGRDQEEQLAYLLDRIRHMELLPADIGLPQMRRYLAIFRTSVTAAHSYVPQVYPESILLLLAEESQPGLQEKREADWSAVAAGGLIIDNVPGNHYSMMRDPDQMARRLRAELDRVIAGMDSATEAHAATQLPV
ncbi:MAG TPA: amino acid adenylation domain-containing protein, partial [Herpetosiphonaceae bacterium]